MKVYVFPPFFSVLRELIKLLGKIPQLMLCMNLTGLRDHQMAGRTVLLGVSVRSPRNKLVFGSGG